MFDGARDIGERDRCPRTPHAHELSLFARRGAGVMLAMAFAGVVRKYLRAPNSEVALRG
jgi:hypothetical protein